MKIIKLKKHNLHEVLDEAVLVLRSGGIIVHPSDTCYGIAADIFNEKAIKKVYNFKKRDIDKPINIIVKNIDDFKKYGGWNELISDFLSKEKMHSFVVRKTANVPKFLNPEFNNLGIQIPRHCLSREMLIKMNGPLTATSANISGENSVYSVKELLAQTKESEVLPDLIIDAGEIPKNEPSKIIEIINSNKYKILRY